MSLPLEEVCRILDQGRERELLFAVNTLGAQFGLADAEVLAELQAGNLVATRTADEAGQSGPEMWNSAMITFDGLLRWLGCGSPISQRAYAHLWERNHSDDEADDDE